MIFYVAASLLTMLCVMTFALLYTSGHGIQEYVNDVFERCVVEDANIETLASIPEEEIAKYEEEYHLLMEEQEFMNVYDVKVLDNDGKDVTAKDTEARVFKENSKINKYVITKQNIGQNYESVNDLKDDEILINEKYATRHNITLNNTANRIILNGKEFKVVGYFIRPDYLYGLVNTTDAYPNYDSFMVAYINDAQYDSFKENDDGKISAASTYSLKLNVGGKTDEEALRKDIFDNYISYQYNYSQSSRRIRVFYIRPQMFISFSFLFLAVMPVFIVLIISIILNIKVTNDQKIIGTIRALGYRDSELCYHYSIMSMIPGLVGGILMTIIVYLTSGFFGRIAIGDFEVMSIDFIYPWYTAILGIIIPTLIYTVVSVLTVKRLINKPITELLRGAGKESKSSKILMNKRTKVIPKFAVRSLTANKIRTFVIFLGIMASTLIISLSLIQFDTIDAIVSQAMKKAGDFEYEYTLKVPDIVEEEEDLKSDKYNYMIATIYEYDERKIPLMGASVDNMNLWYTTLTDGTKITELDENSFYMSKLCAELMHVKKGDPVTIKSNFNTDPLTFKVSGIIDNGLISYILTDKANVIDSYFSTIKSLINDTVLDPDVKEILCDFFDNSDRSALDSLYNIVLSKEALDDKYDASNIINIFQKSSIEKQKDAKMKERAVIIYTVLVIGILICIISVFTIVNVIIDDNQANISLMLVLGHKPKEINRMIINCNHVIVPFGIAAGIPLAYLILSLYFKNTVANNNMVMPVTVSIRSLIIIIGTVLVTYFGTLAILKTKASKVSMTDSLKDNR